MAHRYLKEKDAAKLFAQLVSAVWYIHQKKIVHRDLKLENLLLDRHRNVIVTDFGFANRFEHRSDDLMQTSCGSPCYAAPELVISEGLYVGSAVDIWSCGVILYAMLAGYLPFDDDPANPEGDNINLLYKYILNTQLTFPDYVSPEARDLLSKMLVPDPAKRATLQVVMEHEWLAGHRALFERTLDECEGASKEMQEQKRTQYRRQMRERERQRREREKERQHLDRGDNIYDSPDTGGLSSHQTGRRAVASAIVMPSAPPVEHESYLMDASSHVASGHMSTPPIASTYDEAGASSRPRRESRSSTKDSGTPTKKSKPGSSGKPGSGDASGKKATAGGFRHTIQLEYDEETTPATPSAPVPSRSSKKRTSEDVGVNGYSPTREENLPTSAVGGVDIAPSPSRAVPAARRGSSSTRATAAGPAPVLPPSSYSPPTARARGPNTSPTTTRNPAEPNAPNSAYPGSDYSTIPTPTNDIPPTFGYATSESQGSLPVDPSVQSAVPAVVQDESIRPASKRGRHTRGISIDKIMGKFFQAGGVAKEDAASLASPTSGMSQTGGGVFMTSPTAVNHPRAKKDTVELSDSSALTSSTKASSAAGASTATVGVSPFESAKSLTATSGQDSSAVVSKGSKKRAGKALSLMVDPITKIKESRAKNRASVAVALEGGNSRLDKGKEKSEPLVNGKPETTEASASEGNGASVDPPMAGSASTGWRLPLFRDSSTVRRPTAPVPAPVAPATMPPLSGMGMAATGASTKSQGVMDWFRKKSLAKERRRAGSVVINLDNERAKTPTQELAEEAKTPTRKTFNADGTTPSLIVTTAAGETSSNKSGGDTASNSTTPSRMDRLAGAIKNVTSTPPSVSVPMPISKRTAAQGYNKLALRLHDGPVEPSNLSSASPHEIISHVLEILKSLGIEYSKESEFKYRCIRPKKRKVGSMSLAKEGTSGSGTSGIASSSSAVNGVSFVVSCLFLVLTGSSSWTSVAYRCLIVILLLA